MILFFLKMHLSLYILIIRKQERIFLCPCFSDQIKIKYLKMGNFFFPKN